MPAIRISIGAAADSTLASAFDPLIVSAKKARATVQKEMAATSKSVTAEAKRGADAASKASAEATKAIVKNEAERARATEKASQQATKAALKEFDERIKASGKRRAQEAKDEAASVKDAEKAIRKRAALEKAALDKSTRDRISATREFGGRIASNLGATTRVAGGVAAGVLSGMGVDLSLQSHVANATEVRRIATNISNQGYQEGDPTKTRMDPKEIEAHIKGAADVGGFSRGEAAVGLEKFVNLTGELKTGLALLPEMSRLAQATGSGLDDMAAAAGNVANNLKSIPEAERSAAVLEVLNAWSAMSKTGAVEMADASTQAAKLGAAAQQIEGSPVENLKKMMALVQMSRSEGGAASATQAATSLMGLENTFKTPARVNAFKAEGIDVFGKGGKIRDPEQLIKEGLEKTGGDPLRFKKLFASVIGAKPAEAAANTYRTAGGGKAGLAAVQKEFDDYQKQAISKGELKDSLAARMDDPSTKAQLFNNKMDDLAEKLEGKLIPAFEKLEPLALKLADAFIEIAGMAANNPIQAALIAVAASIAKAGAGQIVADGLKKLFESSAGSPIAIATATFVITAAALAEMFDAQDKARSQAVASGAVAATDIANADVNPTQANLEKLQADKDALESKIKAGEGYNNESGLTHNVLGVDGGSALLNFASFGHLGTSLSNQEGAKDAGEHLAVNKADLASVNAALAAVHQAILAQSGKTQNVNVVGGMPGVPPTVDHKGRSQ